jgi:uncharacterized protein (DUF1499 family)
MFLPRLVTLLAAMAVVMITSPARRHRLVVHGFLAATKNHVINTRHPHGSNGALRVLPRPSSCCEDGVMGGNSNSVQKTMTAAVAAMTILASCVAGGAVPVAVAADGDTAVGTAAAASPPTTTPTSYSIEQCSVSSKVPCLSTSNVRQLDLYMAPWTYPSTYTGEEVMARLKGVVVSIDPNSNRIVRQDGDRRLIVEVSRPNDLFGTKDTLEFVINGVDHVVTFRSSASTETNDFGLQRRRLDDIRRRSGGLFGVMGDALNTADSVTYSERGNGPLGQLKAFYGLQAGAGYEDVLAE